MKKPAKTKAATAKTAKTAKAAAKAKVARAAKIKPDNVVRLAVLPRPTVRITPEVVQRSKAKPRANEAAHAGAREGVNPYIVHKPPPGVVPEGEATMAMDNAIIEVTAWAASAGIGGSFANGAQFLGYPYLSELAQIPEYRKPVETIATQMTRKWIKLQASGEENAQLKEDKIKRLNVALENFKVRDVVREAVEQDGIFGRSHIFFDIRDPEAADAASSAVELRMPIGDGRSALSRMKVQKGWLRRITTVEPVWTYPTTYNSNNPLAPDWYNPQDWYVMGKHVHGSRLLKLVSREVPDMLKPAYSFGGLSLLQMMKPYVDNWLRTRQSVADTIWSFSTSGIKTDMGAAALAAGGQEFYNRVDMFNNIRNNRGLMVLSKEEEEFFQINTPLSTLDALQAQSQEHMAAVSSIPLVFLLGITPQGLNASSEGEIRVFYDFIAALQIRLLQEPVRRIIDFIQLNEFGEVDPDITFIWEPLWSMDEKALADVDKTQAETDDLRINAGVISPLEVRKRVANDPNSPYSGLDADDLPEPPDEQLGGPGMNPGEAHPDDPNQDPEGGGGSPGGINGDEGFEEGKHPRADNGQFGSGGPSLKMADLKKQGNQLGSNPGGVYSDKEGKKFYIKHAATKAHAQNEKTAAKLYQLAGANTLKYRDVDGDQHVATEWQELDKKNINDFTPEQRKEAAKDFAVHAWLSNWDAAGLGGDNQGVLNGKTTTLDVGGSLRFRAQGGPKGGAFGDKVSEFDTLRDKKMNPDAAGLFGKMSPEEIKASVEQVASIPDAKIRAVVGNDKELADRLIARKKDLASRVGIIAKDEINPDDLEEGEDPEDFEDGPEAEEEFFAEDEAKFEEGKHPRAANGQFGSGGGAAAPKLKKGEIGKLSDSEISNHFSHAAKFMTSPVKNFPNYRTQLKLTIAAAKQGGAPAATVKKLELKLAEFYANHVEKMKAAGQPEKAKASKKKAEALGWKFDAAAEKKDESKVETMKMGVSLINPPKPEPKSESMAGKHTLDKSFASPDKFVIKKPDGTVINNANGMSMKFDTEEQAKEYAKSADEGNAPHQIAEKHAAAVKEANSNMLAEIDAKNKAEMAALHSDPSIVALAGILTSKYELQEYLDIGKNAQKKLAENDIHVSVGEAALIQSYIGSHYKTMNVQSYQGALSPSQYKYKIALTKALMKMPIYEGKVVRGIESITPAIFAKYKEDHIVPSVAIMSAGKENKLWGNYTLEIHGKSARDLSILNPHEGGGEVVFLPNTAFHVESNNGSKAVLKEIVHD